MRFLLSRMTLARKLRLAMALIAGLMAFLGLWQALSLRQSRAEALALFEHRLVPLQRLKRVSDAFHFEIVYTARQVRATLLPAREGLLRIRKSRQEGLQAWEAYLQGRSVQAHPALASDTQVKLDACQALLD